MTSHTQPHVAMPAMPCHTQLHVARPTREALRGQARQGCEAGLRGRVARQGCEAGLHGHPR